MTTSEVIGATFCGGGVAVSLLNFYLSFLRYPLYRALGRSHEGYRHVSGLPLIGSLAVWIGAPFIRAYPIPMWIALALSLLDMAGMHVFLIVLVVAARKSN